MIPCRQVHQAFLCRKNQLQSKQASQKSKAKFLLFLSSIVEYIELFKDGHSRFEIIYADDIKAKATRFANDLSRVLEARVDCKSETEECDAEFEILIGGTNREASENAMQKIKVSADWLIQVDGNKIVINTTQERSS